MCVPWLGDQCVPYGVDQCVPCLCVPFTGDSVRHRVEWRGAPGTPSPAAGPFMLRFHLKDARLYSFWFQ